ncbi:MAG TPA: NUDIX hydrolase [Candidatus Saccharimonadales bacterium]|nr:NUDIX hydrolase [Candidatus Saccharimonadales bacterium]
MTNIYRHSAENHHHLSVGAIIVNDKGQVLCHHHLETKHFGPVFHDLYLLMRETVEPNEALEAAVQRGCLEEMGAEVNIAEYLGPIVAKFSENGREIEKTTLYFRCQLIKLDAGLRDSNDPESSSVLEWHDTDFLIKKSADQARELGRADIDESAILQRLS